jgi:hypothetical protein
MSKLISDSNSGGGTMIGGWLRGTLHEAALGRRISSVQVDTMVERIATLVEMGNPGLISNLKRV